VSLITKNILNKYISALVYLGNLLHLGGAAVAYIFYTGGFL
jgi:hypothetical protein